MDGGKSEVGKLTRGWLGVDELLANLEKQTGTRSRRESVASVQRNNEASSECNFSARHLSVNMGLGVIEILKLNMCVSRHES